MWHSFSANQSPVCTFCHCASKVNDACSLFFHVLEQPFCTPSSFSHSLPSIDFVASLWFTSHKTLCTQRFIAKGLQEPRAKDFWLWWPIKSCVRTCSLSCWKCHIAPSKEGETIFIDKLLHPLTPSIVEFMRVLCFIAVCKLVTQAWSGLLSTGL